MNASEIICLLALPGNQYSPSNAFHRISVTLHFRTAAIFLSCLLVTPLQTKYILYLGTYTRDINTWGN